MPSNKKIKENQEINKTLDLQQRPSFFKNVLKCKKNDSAYLMLHNAVQKKILSIPRKEQIAIMNAENAEKNGKQNLTSQVNIIDIKDTTTTEKNDYFNIECTDDDLNEWMNMMDNKDKLAPPEFKK